ncbi:hypothetical protein OJAV_G00193190 [Oryzias javanicus]|uniref:Dynein attachment factor N-terminal domain-containing protein n=1 Tax=Oryzias javanicus TaxID=123683 RepID=A0A3S2LRZ3_ORYJA|nr:hypothetical protein OJAV_G00193190 [Oryzias javanicus]
MRILKFPRRHCGICPLSCRRLVNRNRSWAETRRVGGTRAASTRCLQPHLLRALKMSQRDVIDFSALERELKAAVESERRYDRENETKLRAVNQGVSYQQFRNLVLSSHLKPLEKKDTHNAPRKQPWNPVVPNNT